MPDHFEQELARLVSLYTSGVEAHGFEQLAALLRSAYRAGMTAAVTGASLGDMLDPADIAAAEHEGGYGGSS